MTLYENKLYMDDVHYVGDLSIPWNRLQNKRLMLSGSTGLIGSFLIDVILEKNRTSKLNCTVFALGRDEKKARERFSMFEGDPHFVFIPCDVNNPLANENLGTIDYVLHLASNTHPYLYSTDPIGTITTNIVGVMNMLEFANAHHTTRFGLASSNEIYGENRGDVEFFDEKYCGYIDCNTLRAGYPESKRCSEALCQAFRVQKAMDVVIARITRSYGPTMNMNDTKAISQFIQKGIAHEDIVLKSAGAQYYSFTYVADAVSGLLFTLLAGENGEAYNIAEEKNDITLKDLAEYIATLSGSKVVYECPDAIEAAGYSKANKARLNGLKLQLLGWKPKYDIRSGVKRTIEVLEALRKE